MGKALYRKHRPKKLSEVIGQEPITQTLTNALKSGHISHAYLLTGPRGTGKTSIARILAHEVNQLPYEDNATHLDIIEIDAASNRRIDEIRELRDRIHIAPTSAKYKVYIIDEVHMLTREAFNALLKTLEEPPEHAIFVLATTEAHKLPDTIISRTQRFSLKPVDLETVVNHLRNIAKAEGITIDDEALRLVAEHGQGSFRDSIGLLDQIKTSGGDITVTTVESALGRAPQELIHDTLRAIASQDAQKLASVLTQLREQAIQPGELSAQLSDALRREVLGSTEPASQRSLSLLRELMNVPHAHNPQLALELALFEPFSSEDQPNIQPSATGAQRAVPVVKPEQTAAPKPAPEKLSPKPDVQEPKVTKGQIPAEDKPSPDYPPTPVDVSE
ncbi:DNA polymerase III subunit gamma/tau, partial [Candidatus Saccharibacteria bacterium]|nr:DNA polymerase III subunit gamma/tau [Candidatus Saccharibacteria bacterium]